MFAVFFVVVVLVVSLFPFLNQALALKNPHDPSENPADLDEEVEAVTQYDSDRELARQAIKRNAKFAYLTSIQIDQWATMYALNREDVSLTIPPREVSGINIFCVFCFCRCSYDTKVMFFDSLFVCF